MKLLFLDIAFIGTLIWGLFPQIQAHPWEVFIGVIFAAALYGTYLDFKEFVED